MINKIKNMKVEEKLKYCFTLVVLMASISGILGIIIMMFINNSYANALVTNGFSQGEIGIFSTYLNKEPSLIREMILVDDAADLAEISNELDEISVKTDAALVTMKAHCTSAEERPYIETIEEVLPLYRSIFSEVQALAMNDQNEEALELLLTEGKPTLKKLTDAVEGLIRLNVEVGNSVSQTLSITAIAAIGLMIVVIIVVFIIAVRFASFVAKLFAEPIIQVKEAAAKLADGDLNITVHKMYPDEIGDMAESFHEAAQTLKSYIHELTDSLGEIAEGNFNIKSHAHFKGDFKAIDDAIVIFTDTLSGTLGNIHESSEQVALGASQMAESAQALAEGATDQAASVEELTATIQSITETIIYSSKKAEESFHNAEKFKGEAEGSSEDIKQLNEAMTRINDTSKEIANIITAIEDIASQTNLLSLNASIEAARAGDTGRGFAVVADQIGKLAADSAASAANTRDLIENSIREIENGNVLMQKATQAIGSVIRGINVLAESTNEISTLSISQADTMKQLEVGVEQISEVIQNNSAAAEQSSATSEELSAQSETLEELVGQFKLKG
ncbi:MAG: HAMP domain-containing protein [Lachnospiraceae bacterium]|nr:HAMP domain-containing protein [Lachnospiraceae bacterium]